MFERFLTLVHSILTLVPPLQVVYFISPYSSWVISCSRLMLILTFDYINYSLDLLVFLPLPLSFLSTFLYLSLLFYNKFMRNFPYLRLWANELNIFLKCKIKCLYWFHLVATPEHLYNSLFQCCCCCHFFLRDNFWFHGQII